MKQIVILVVFVTFFGIVLEAKSGDTHPKQPVLNKV